MEDNRRGLFEGERIDNFVDGAFAFVVTLLVINGASIPHDIPSLINALGGVTAFAAAFAQLALFWYGHVQWRDLVGRSDKPGLLLSLMLVFFALIFVYPPHMVFASFFHAISGGVLPMDFAIRGMGDLKVLFTVYGMTYACMAGTLAALFWHGMRAGWPVYPRHARGGWGFRVQLGLYSLCRSAVGLDRHPDPAQRRRLADLRGRHGLRFIVVHGATDQPLSTLLGGTAANMTMAGRRSAHAFAYEMRPAGGLGRFAIKAAPA